MSKQSLLDSMANGKSRLPPEQRLRLVRTGMSALAYVMWGVILLLAHLRGWLELSGFQVALFFVGIFLTNLVFALLILTQRNLRFREPSMTMPQIAVAIIWALLVLAASPEIRGILLLLLFTIFFFGVFRLRTGQFLVLAMLAILGYGAILLYEAADMSRRELELQLLHWAVMATVLLWLSFMGGHVASLRERLRRALAERDLAARRDDLTGTGNRREMQASLDAALAQSRESGRPFSLCLLDLDYFKQLNDRFGHIAGDEILRRFAERMAGTLRGLSGDDVARSLARFGGEEFVVVLPDTDLAGAFRCAQRLREALTREPFEIAGQSLPVTMSVGVSEWQPDEHWEGTLSRADKALYLAKERGRNRIEVVENR